jgi:GAF domain-containing protein
VTGEAAAEAERVAEALAGAAGLPERLRLLLTHARRLTGAEAGTLYVREGGTLRFEAAQNDALTRRLGEADATHILTSDALALAERSIASYVALTRQPVNIPDVYEIPPDRPYEFNRRFDARNDYRTRSMLAVPVRDARGGVFGVLQLINRVTETGTVAVFDRRRQELIEAVMVRVAPLIPARPRTE